MRHFTTVAVALALEVSPKWLDNLLSRHSFAPSTRGRQGHARRMSPRAILAVGIAWDLHRAVGIPLRQAVTVAARLSAHDSPTQLHIARGIALRVDIPKRVADLQHRLAVASESAPRPTRGRPRLRRTR